MWRARQVYRLRRCQCVYTRRQHIRRKRDRILKAASEIGYRVNLVVHGLNRQRTDPIDMIASRMSNPYRTEQTIRSVLPRKLPDGGFIGEVTGGETGADGTWLMDPTDGTADHLRGLRHWDAPVAA